MPQHNDITIPANGWALITSGGVSGSNPVRIQNNGGGMVRVQATATTALLSGRGPAAGGLYVAPGETGSIVLPADFGGVANAAHLQAFADDARGSILSVSHA